MNCPACGHTESVKNGTQHGKQRYRCRHCGKTHTHGWRGQVHPLVKQLAMILCLNGLGFRRIADILGVSHVSVQNWWSLLGREFKDSPLAAEGGSFEMVEIDELWHWCGKKRQNVALDCCGSSQRENPRLAAGFSWEKGLETPAGEAGKIPDQAFRHRSLEGLPKAHFQRETHAKQKGNIHRGGSQLPHPPLFRPLSSQDPLLCQKPPRLAPELAPLHGFSQS